MRHKKRKSKNVFFTNANVGEEHGKGALRSVESATLFAFTLLLFVENSASIDKKYHNRYEKKYLGFKWIVR